MKILFVVKNYYPSVGGTQIFFQQMAEYFTRFYNDDVSVYTIDSIYGSEKRNYQKAGPEFEVINGVKVYRFPYVRWHLKYFIFIAKCLSWLHLEIPSWIRDGIIGPCSPRLKKAIIRSEADMIVGSSSNYLHMRYPIWKTGLYKRKPFLFQGAIHFKANEASKVYTARTLMAIKASDVYLANTSFEKDMLVKAGVNEEKIQVLGCAVCVRTFEPGALLNIKQKLGLPADALLVGYIGRLSPMKSLDVLIDAMVLVWKKSPAAYLILAGHDNDYLDKLHNQIRQLNREQQKQVIVLVDLDEQVKLECFHAIDIFAMPSINESFGIVFLEAWACKKPVIAARIKALESVVTENVDGLFMEPGNSESLADKILQLIDDKTLASQMGEAGYEKVIENYDINKVAEKLRNICLGQIKNN